MVTLMLVEEEQMKEGMVTVKLQTSSSQDNGSAGVMLVLIKVKHVEYVILYSVTDPEILFLMACNNEHEYLFIDNAISKKLTKYISRNSRYVFSIL